MSFEVSGDGLTRFSIIEFAPGSRVPLIIDGDVKDLLSADALGIVNFTVELSSTYTKVEIGDKSVKV